VDDFVVLVHGSQADTEALRADVARVLAPMCVRLSAARTRVSHIDEGLDFVGFGIQRRREPGTTRRVVDTYPSKKAVRGSLHVQPSGSAPSSGGSAR